MIHSPARILAVLLQQDGFFSAPSSQDDWPVFTDGIPDSSSVPDTAASVNDTSSEKKFRLISGEGSKWSWGFQIFVRVERYPTGWNKLKEVQDYLDLLDKTDVTVDDDDGTETYTIQDVDIRGSVTDAGPEEGTDRMFLSLNGMIWFG